jgi:uncharacterized membrane protein
VGVPGMDFAAGADVVPDKTGKVTRHWAVTVLILGMALGGYLWEFLNTNLDFTGPQNLHPVSGALLTLLGGPCFLLCLWGLSGAILARRFGLSWAEGLRWDAPSYLPVSLLGLSPVVYLMSGHHTPAYQAEVIVPVSLVVSGVAAIKVWQIGQIVQSSRQRTSNRPFPYQRIVYLAVAAYIVLFSALSLLRYAGHHYWLVDMGLDDQALWNTTQGRFLDYTFYNGVQMNLLADHVEPILLSLVPLYLVWADPRTLLIVRVIGTALTALPLYALAEEVLDSRFAAMCVALAYLVFPSVVDSGLHGGGNIRTDVFALLFLVGALYYLHKERWLPVVIFLVLALLCKEHVPLVVAALGLYVAYRHRRPKLGLALLVLGLGYFALAVGWFLPLMRGGQPSRHFALSLSALGGDEGPAGILRTVISNPGILLSVLLKRPQLDFSFFFFFSFGMLPLLDLPLFLVSIPVFGLFMFYPGIQYMHDFHFLIPLAFAFGSSIGGIRHLAAGDLRWLARFIPALGTTGTRSLAVFLFSMSLCAGFFWAPGPLSWGFWTPSRPYTYWKGIYTVDDHARRADRFVSLVPEKELVIVSDYAEIRLTHRERIYTFFAPPPDSKLSKVDYALVDLFENHIRNEEMRAREMELFRWLLQEFNLMAFEDGLLYLERHGEDGFHTAAEVVAAAEPQHRLDASFGDRVRLLGYDLAASELQRGQRYRIVYYWQVLEGFDRPFALQHAVNPDSTETLNTNWVLIDTFSQGKAQFRVIHLPTHILLPPDQWQPGQILREVYDFVLPGDLPAGEYDWQVGLYAVPAWFAIETEPSRLVPGTDTLHLARTRVW